MKIQNREFIGEDSLYFVYKKIFKFFSFVYNFLVFVICISVTVIGILQVILLVVISQGVWIVQDLFEKK